jgi:hypothetical protein
VRQDTLARQLVPVASANYFDLEDRIRLARLEEPLTCLGDRRGPSAAVVRPPSVPRAL